MSAPLRVGVTGAAGKMGRALCGVIMEDPALDLVAAVDRTSLGAAVGDLTGRGGGPRIDDRLEALTEAAVDVAVDFTHPDAVMDHVRWYASHGLAAVIGTTGVGPQDRAEAERLACANAVSLMICPDFSPIGVIFLHLGKILARYLDEVELSETHPPAKAEAPSGTTMNTARTLAALRAGVGAPPSASREIVAGARGGLVDGIRVHAFRLSGPVGAEEMRFAHEGDILTLSTVSFSRQGYAAGVVLAIKAIRDRPGLTWGLEPILGFET